MVEMTATEFARNLSRALDRLERGGDEVVITRNGHPVARLAPGAPRMTALEAFSDIYGILSASEGAAWAKDMRGMDQGRKGRFTDPWA